VKGSNERREATIKRKKDREGTTKRKRRMSRGGQLIYEKTATIPSNSQSPKGGGRSTLLTKDQNLKGTFPAKTPIRNFFPGGPFVRS